MMSVTYIVAYISRDRLDFFQCNDVCISSVNYSVALTELPIFTYDILTTFEFKCFILNFFTGHETGTLDYKNEKKR